MSVHIDCDTCLVRGAACRDCVVTVLLGPPPELGFDSDEQRALDVLAESGLVAAASDGGSGDRPRRRVRVTGRVRAAGCTAKSLKVARIARDP